MYYKPLNYVNETGYLSPTYGEMYGDGYGYNFYYGKGGYYDYYYDIDMIMGPPDTGASVAIFVGILVGLCCIGFGCCGCGWKRNKDRKKAELQKVIDRKAKQDKYMKKMLYKSEQRVKL